MTLISLNRHHKPISHLTAQLFLQPFYPPSPTGIRFTPQFGPLNGLGNSRLDRPADGRERLLPSRTWDAARHMRTVLTGNPARTIVSD